jgi:hypothetical protein
MNLNLRDEPRPPIPSAGIPTLAVLALSVSAVAFYPATVQFNNTPDGPGEWWDANFMGLVSAAILQVLNFAFLALGSVLWPEMLCLPSQRETRLSLVVVGGLICICTIMSPLLYGLVSARWSGMVAFTGQALTGLLQFFLVFGP